MRANQDQRQVGWVPVVCQAAEVVINRLEAVLILQTEDKDDGIDPQSELEGFKHNFVSHRATTNTLIKNECRNV